jgi:hypothetical protein
MQTMVRAKFDIISYVAGLTDKQLIQELYQWVMTKNRIADTTYSMDFMPPKRKGSLTAGYGIWSDGVVDTQQNDRKNIWGTERNAW